MSQRCVQQLSIWHQTGLGQLQFLPHFKLTSPRSVLRLSSQPFRWEGAEREGIKKSACVYSPLVAEAQLVGPKQVGVGGGKARTA